MKKLLIFSALFVIGFAHHALADGFTALAPIPGLTDTSATSVINSATLATFFNNLYKYLIGVAATIAVIEIIWGGIEYSTTDSIGNKEEGKKRIQDAIFGLILVLSPVLVFSIINPSILNLSLNLPPINLTTTSYTNTVQTITCTSNCNAGVPGATDGSSGGSAITTGGITNMSDGLYACDATAGCAAATKTCESQSNTVGQTFAGVTVCVTSGGAIDSNKTPPCPSTERAAVQCVESIQSP